MHKKIIVIVVALLVLGVGGWGIKKMVWERSADPTQRGNQDAQPSDEMIPEDTDEEALVAEGLLSSQEEAQLSSQCENGEWVDVGAVNGETKTVSGRLTVDVPYDDELETLNPDVNYLINETTTLKADDEKKLSYFEDRTVEVSGVQAGDTITVAKVRCIGKETDKALIAFRQEVMKDISSRINELSPEKGTWEVVDFSWPNDSHVYVEYAAAGGDEEAENQNYYSLLLEVSKGNQRIDTKQLAFLKMGEEEWEVVSGTDTYQDVEQVDYYEFDDRRQSWVKLD